MPKKHTEFKLIGWNLTEKNDLELLAFSQPSVQLWNSVMSVIKTGLKEIYSKLSERNLFETIWMQASAEGISGNNLNEIDQIYVPQQQTKSHPEWLKALVETIPDVFNLLNQRAHGQK